MPYRAVRCPRCRTSDLVYRTLQLTGDVYTVCSEYPRCSYVGGFEDSEIQPEHRGIQAG